MFCNQCGHRNPSGARFCSSCGAVLAPSSGDDTTITFTPVEAAGDVADEELSVSLQIPALAKLPTFKVAKPS